MERIGVRGEWRVRRGWRRVRGRREERGKLRGDRGRDGSKGNQR